MYVYISILLNKIYNQLNGLLLCGVPNHNDHNVNNEFHLSRMTFNTGHRYSCLSRCNN